MRQHGLFKVPTSEQRAQPSLIVFKRLHNQQDAKNMKLSESQTAEAICFGP
jgi:hypothetical protein